MTITTSGNLLAVALSEATIAKRTHDTFRLVHEADRAELESAAAALAGIVAVLLPLTKEDPAAFLEGLRMQYLRAERTR